MNNVFNTPLAWMLFGLLMALFEMMAPGVFLIFFSIGALFTALACYLFDITFWFQIVIFLSISLISLLCLRNYLKMILFSRVNKTKEDMDNEFIGTKVIVQAIISPEKPGKVLYKGSLWAAESSETIASGEFVEIIGQRSITFIVKTISNDIN